MTRAVLQIIIARVSRPYPNPRLSAFCCRIRPHDPTEIAETTLDAESLVEEQWRLLVVLLFTASD